ncbi:nucleoside-diphosphate-sugar epimerase [Fibrobacter sp. UWR4]|uniref:NAD-dependent epimerase/dehydratase family protein n=1 Tax=Fibrobacter sp. UWR4 TaxID=1896218 RepID=UPI000D6B0692|nr:NAD-dependent epimerase/dehydratase family protein [Fibrobacter sp. UWR4]PWJ61062.1 nucleoside-diphosphate-sugar epimerase [Fibrobacter sp. UWR4]
MSYQSDILEAANQDLPREKLQGKNILVTGATGLIGCCIVETLLKHLNLNLHVYASGRSEERIKTIFKNYLNSNYFHFLKHDILNPLECDIDFHYIVAAAGVASPQLYSTDPISVIKSNLWGIDNILKYGINHHLEKFVYVSSGEIYGEGDGRDFTEDYSGYVNCASLRACYPSAKRASESLCIAYSHQYNVDLCIARPCHVYGPNFSDTDNRVYAQFMRNVLNDENIVLKSSGNQYRSWCYVVDCASAILHIMLKGGNGQAYNIADPSSNLSIKELAEMIASCGHKKVVFEIPTDAEKKGFNTVTKSIFSIADSHRQVNPI